MSHSQNIINENSFSKLSDEAFIRQSQLIPNLIPFSAATLWRKVKAGQFPRPVKLSQRVTAWRVCDIKQWLHSAGKS